MTEQVDVFDSDAKRLSELGYSQDLKRGWSSFQNFAISFSIISVLAGPFTSFSQAWLNGGPLMISIGWPVVSVFILIVGLCMAELASAIRPPAAFTTGHRNSVGPLGVGSPAGSTSSV
jgi:amino acid permease